MNDALHTLPLQPESMGGSIDVLAAEENLVALPPKSMDVRIDDASVVRKTSFARMKKFFRGKDCRWGPPSTTGALHARTRPKHGVSKAPPSMILPSQAVRVASPPAILRVQLVSS